MNRALSIAVGNPTRTGNSAPMILGPPSSTAKTIAAAINRNVIDESQTNNGLLSLRIYVPRIDFNVKVSIRVVRSLQFFVAIELYLIVILSHQLPQLFH